LTNIYFISGLGADYRAFGKLTFPSEFCLIPIDWIAPQLNESLVNYADRLSLKIDSTTPFYLIGLSFGGMLATEIAKKLNPIHTFLISSAATYKEIPWYFRAAGVCNLQKIIPISILRNKRGLGLKYMGAKTADDLDLLIQLVKDSDPYFMKWALTAILKWKNLEIPTHVTRIHGTADYILPIRYLPEPEIILKKGGHFMVYANGKDISQHLQRIMQQDNLI
jgi:pimeloyl-ACP methyl ester carboxylesterase